MQQLLKYFQTSVHTEHLCSVLFAVGLPSKIEGPLQILQLHFFCFQLLKSLYTLGLAKVQRNNTFKYISIVYNV